MVLRQVGEARHRSRDRPAAGALDGEESRMRHPAEHHHHAQPLERFELTQEVGPTAFDLARRQPVRGWRAASDRAHEGVLETAFSYPADYAPPDRDPRAPFFDAISVRAVEPAGEGPVFTGTVRDTHTLFLTAGVLCGE